MFLVKNVADRGRFRPHGGWTCGFFTIYYNNYYNILFWAILSYSSIDCAKIIMVNYGLLSYRFIAAVYII